MFDYFRSVFFIDNILYVRSVGIFAVFFRFAVLGSPLLLYKNYIYMSPLTVTLSKYSKKKKKHTHTIPQSWFFISFSCSITFSSYHTPRCWQWWQSIVGLEEMCNNMFFSIHCTHTLLHLYLHTYISVSIFFFAFHEATNMCFASLTYIYWKIRIYGRYGSYLNKSHTNGHIRILVWGRIQNKIKIH